MLGRLLSILALVASCYSAIAQSSLHDGSSSGANVSGQTPKDTDGKPAGTGEAVASGLRIAGSADLAVRFVDVKPADMLATSLIGVKLFNNQNEELGQIDDIVIENGKSIAGMVIRFGGFLGVGENRVVLDPATVVVSQRDGTWRAYVNMSAETLKHAPKFAGAHNG